MNLKEKHILLMKNYKNQVGSKSEVSSKLETELDLLLKNHQFLRTEEEGLSVKDYGSKIAQRYYQKLFKEYALVELSKYEQGKIALRWRTKDEVVEGKGQFICAALDCQEQSSLKSFELNFMYVENKEQKQTLVKVRVCPKCAQKVNHKRKMERINIQDKLQQEVDRLVQSEEQEELKIRQSHNTREIENQELIKKQKLYQYQVQYQERQQEQQNELQQTQKEQHQQKDEIQQQKEQKHYQLDLKDLEQHQEQLQQEYLQQQKQIHQLSSLSQRQQQASAQMGTRKGKSQVKQKSKHKQQEQQTLKQQSLQKAKYHTLNGVNQNLKLNENDSINQNSFTNRIEQVQEQNHFLKFQQLDKPSQQKNTFQNKNGFQKQKGQDQQQEDGRQYDINQSNILNTQIQTKKSEQNQKYSSLAERFLADLFQ